MYTSTCPLISHSTHIHVVFKHLRINYFLCMPLINVAIFSLSNDEVEMRQLASDNVQCIHDLYPAAEVESIEVFEKLIHQLPGCGIFSLKTGELVAWMVQSYYGKRRAYRLQWTWFR